MKYFKTECKNLFLSPKRLFYVLVLPFIIFGFFAAIFYKGVPRDLPMAYINYDQSQLSENLLRMLDATPNIDLKIKLTDEQEAQRLIQQQQIMGFIVIPADFQQKLFKGENQSVICYTNNQFMLGASLIQKDFQTTIGTFSWIGDEKENAKRTTNRESTCGSPTYKGRRPRFVQSLC